MQANRPNASQAGYKMQQATTGGYLNDGLAAPASGSGSVYEPSPLTAGGGKWALATMGYNVLLHVLALGFACVAAVYHIPNSSSNSLTFSHTADFVASWLYVMVFGQIAATALTLFYYACILKASAFPIPGALLLGLQLTTLVSSIKLSYYMAINNWMATNKLSADGDWAIVVTMYLQIFVVAGFIMTPISGTYYKIAYPEAGPHPILKKSSPSQHGSHSSFSLPPSAGDSSF